MKPRQRDEALIAEVAAQVYRRRKELGLTLAQLAQRAGVTQNHIGNIEGGKVDVTTSSIGYLAKGLGCAPRDLLGPPGLSHEQRRAVEDEVAMMLHAHRDCLRNRGVDTSKTRFDTRCSYWGEAFGILRGLKVLGHGNWGPDAGLDNLQRLFGELQDRALREENYGGSNECDHCLERYGKDGAGRKR